MLENRTSRIHSPFTFVELMAVVTVLIILASLMLPALKSAKGMAKQMHCLGNMKQLGALCTQYANDYGYLPASQQQGTDWHSRYWQWNYGIGGPDSITGIRTIGLTGLGYIAHNGYLGNTGNNGNTRSPLACPEATVASTQTIGLNQNLDTSTGMLGPNFKYPDRLAYVSDTRSTVFYRLYVPLMATDGYSINLRHQNQDSFNVVYADLHGDMRNKNSITVAATANEWTWTPFWWPGPTWKTNGNGAITSTPPND